MKFTVRKGFVVHSTKIVEVQQNGRKAKQEQTNSFWEGDTVEFDDVAEARDHAHKLEAADKDAEKFLSGLVLAVAQAAPVAARV